MRHMVGCQNNMNALFYINWAQALMLAGMDAIITGEDRKHGGYRNATIEVRDEHGERKVLPVEVVLQTAGKWSSTYLENYIDYGMKQGEKDKDGKPVKACFAEKKVFSGSVKVKRRRGHLPPTNAEMSKILGLEKFGYSGLGDGEVSA